tara:strand:- start:286 stop:576 length:291 start_codon:yes stop_codon:yes gene_type:complete
MLAWLQIKEIESEDSANPQMRWWWSVNVWMESSMVQRSFPVTLRYLILLARKWKNGMDDGEEVSWRYCFQPIPDALRRITFWLWILAESWRPEDGE